MQGGDFQRYVAGDTIAFDALTDEIIIANLSDRVRARVTIMTEQQRSTPRPEPAPGP